MNKPLFINRSVYDLANWSDLYSGGEHCPITDATLYAMNHIAFDSNGNNLPFSTLVSIFGQDIDRNECLLEDMSKGIRRRGQKICISVLVWQNMDDYLEYENSNELLVL
jgi:hypothetical protein